MTGHPRIVVHVAADGTVSAETVDVFGDACLDYVAVLEDLLDARTVHSGYTADHQRVALRAYEVEPDVDRL
ncbi:DUF2997 domain-containing protein [Polymorphospora rubra]|uniref:DUF2997 domain-containing protein n=1 Tax=Polymorphospora rubra TaxID=338584 RepID=UPI0033DA6422